MRFGFHRTLQRRPHFLAKHFSFFNMLYRGVFVMSAKVFLFQLLNAVVRPSLSTMNVTNDDHELSRNNLPFSVNVAVKMIWILFTCLLW